MLGQNVLLRGDVKNTKSGRSYRLLSVVIGFYRFLSVRQNQHLSSVMSGGFIKTI